MHYSVTYNRPWPDYKRPSVEQKQKFYRTKKGAKKCWTTWVNEVWEDEFCLFWKWKVWRDEDYQLPSNPDDDDEEEAEFREMIQKTPELRYKIMRKNQDEWIFSDFWMDDSFYIEIEKLC